MALDPSAWIKAHKGAAAAIGIGGGAGVIVLYKRRAAQGAATGADGSAPASSTSDGTLPPASYAGDPNTDPSYGAIEQQIQALQAQLLTLTNAKNPSPTPKPKPKPKPKPRKKKFPHEPPPRRGRPPRRGGGPRLKPPHIVRGPVQGNRRPRPRGRMS